MAFRNTPCQALCDAANRISRAKVHFFFCNLAFVIKKVGKSLEYWKNSLILADYDRQQRERKQDAEEVTVMPF